MKWVLILAALTAASMAPAQQPVTAVKDDGRNPFPPNARGIAGIVLSPVDTATRLLARELIAQVGPPLQMQLYLDPATKPAADAFERSARANPNIATVLAKDPNYIARGTRIQLQAQPKIAALRAAEAARFEAILKDYYGSKMSKYDMRATITFMRSEAGRHYAGLTATLDSDILPLMLPVIRDFEPRVSEVYERAVADARSEYPLPAGVEP